MFRDRESPSHQRQHESQLNNNGNPDHKFGFNEKGIDFLHGSESRRDGFCSKPLKIIGDFSNSQQQELTLSYLCDTNNSSKDKGKEIAVGDDERWIERDFWQFNEIGANSSKRDEFEAEIRVKKPKPETLNLSLGLPDTASNACGVHNHNTYVSGSGSVPIWPKPSTSVHSLAQSNNTQTTCSNDFTAASLSYSNSLPFSHNPSCSLTMNSNSIFEYSIGRENDHIWNCEGTNGSVHSRFKPVGDGTVSLSNHGGGMFPMIQGNRSINRDSCNSLQTTHRPNGSTSHSFLPSELPARAGFDNVSENSRARGSVSNLSRSQIIVRQIIFDSIPSMAQILQDLPIETVESMKEYLKIVVAEKKEELTYLQTRLERRSDLNNETLLKANKPQLEVIVSIKTGLASFLSNNLTPSELIDIFLLTRCRNINCKSSLPVDDCDCKIFCANKGFCSSCVCPICLNFDCANNTCSWVSCDVCSHWCHAACGLQKNLIRPGPSLKGIKGTTEVQYHCIGCGHASEMFGFVKDVFVCCAKDWGLQTLVKELDCVRKIFQGSDDFKGQQLHLKAGEMLVKIDAKIISPSDACNFLIEFFNFTDGMTGFPSIDFPSKDPTRARPSLVKDAMPLRQTTALLSSNYSMFNMISSNLQRNFLPRDYNQNDLKNEDTLQFGKSSQEDEFNNLESIVRMKEAEAKMFQTRADEARKEAEGYRRIVRARSEKMEEEYAEKLSKLCLQETEERRRNQKEELKVLENSQCDYYNMKMRMQAEIAGLLEKMESTKHQMV